MYLIAKRIKRDERGTVAVQTKSGETTAALLNYLALKTLEYDIGIVLVSDMDVLVEYKTDNIVDNELEFIVEVFKMCGILLKTPQIISYEEYINGMQDYYEKIKKMSKEETHQLLKKSGVLDENGNQKEQICNGYYYTGKL